MKGRPIIAAAVAAGLIAAMPAMAQQPRGAGNPRETVPLRVKDDQVADMQQKLNDQGFNAGHVDGLWGPDTSAALRRYQAKNGLRQTGQLDQRTLALLGAPNAPSSGRTPANPAAVQPAPAAAPVAAAPEPTRAAPNGNTGAAGAAGGNNQAVATTATTAANAAQPAKGANSFTAEEARGRIEGQGYTQVTDLKKDGNGVWRGRGMKNGASVGVWLDYRGNVGQQ